MAKIDDLLERYGDDLITMDGFNDCILGVVEGCGLEEPVVCYDRALVIKQLMRDMTEEEAEEYFEFNQKGAYVGEGTPCFIDLLQR
jgi:hypothetical protein